MYALETVGSIAGRCLGVEHGPNLTTRPGLSASEMIPSTLRLTGGALPWQVFSHATFSQSMKGQVMTIYQHIRHPHIAARRANRPVKVADQLPRDSAVNRFNTKVALLITRAVGSMWCAYAFALFDLISLPAAIRGGASTIVSWVAQTFLQLVLLSIIMVGQNVQAAAADPGMLTTGQAFSRGRQPRQQSSRFMSQPARPPSNAIGIWQHGPGTRRGNWASMTGRWATG